MPGNTVFWVERGTGVAKEVVDADVEELLARDDGYVWLDIPEPSAADAETFASTFDFHPRAVQAAMERHHVARMHGYTDHFFVVLHRPLRGEGGHVHYLELDAFVGPNFLITTHGPRNPTVPLDQMLTETEQVMRRLRAARIAPQDPMALMGYVVATVTNAEETAINELAEEVGGLEKRVMAHMDDNHPQAFLDELFMVRHVLITIRTMASQSSEIFSRCARVLKHLPEDDLEVIEDLRDRYRRLDRIATSQLDFLGGVSDFYRGRTDTRMTIAAERLAVIAAITLPITALSGIMGMNVIVNAESDPVWIIGLLVVMGIMSGVLLRWAKRQGWW